mgnify:CR=1 FL=1
MKPPRLHLRVALVVAATLSTAVCGYSLNYVASVSSGDWQTVGTWNRPGTPGPADDVYIRGATVNSSRHVQVNGAAGSVNLLFIGEAGRGILTINADGSLSVTGAPGVQVAYESINGARGELYINGGSLSASVTRVGAGSNAGSGFMSITNGTLNAGNMTIGGSSATTQRTGVFQINGAGSTISGGTLTVTNYGTLDFNFGATGISTLNFDSISLGETSTVLIDGAAYTGGSGTFTLLSAATSLTGYNASLFSIAGFGPAYTTELGFDADARSVVLTVTAIPEPATYALAFGALALGLVAYRRKHARS